MRLSLCRNLLLSSLLFSAACTDFSEDELGDPEADELAASVAAVSVCGDGNQGDGELCFGTVTELSADLAGSIETGRLDAGSTMDIAYTIYASNQVKMRKGAGNGSFGGAFTYATGAGPIDTAVGDFDNNGINDVATADYDADRVRIRWGNGASWPNWSTWTVDDRPRRVRAADLNGDGRDDFVSLSSSNGTLSVRLRLSGGGFALPVEYGTSQFSFDFAAADFDNDGDLDLVYGGKDVLSVRRNNGAGGFGAAINTSLAALDATDGGVYGVASGDWNEDGDEDVMLVNGGKTMIRALGDGDGTFSGLFAADLAIGGTTRVLTADLDLDGHDDVVASGGGIQLLLGSGNGNLSNYGTVPGQAQVRDVATGDANGDGTPDLFWVSPAGVDMLLSNP